MDGSQACRCSAGERWAAGSGGGPGGGHLGEAADAEEAVHGAGALVAVHGAQLRPSLGQLPVRVLLVLWAPAQQRAGQAWRFRGGLLRQGRTDGGTYVPGAGRAGSSPCSIDYGNGNCSAGYEWSCTSWLWEVTQHPVHSAQHTARSTQRADKQADSPCRRVGMPTATGRTDVAVQHSGECADRWSSSLDLVLRWPTSRWDGLGVSRKGCRHLQAGRARSGRASALATTRVHVGLCPGKWSIATQRGAAGG